MHVILLRLKINFWQTLLIRLKIMTYFFWMKNF